ncbi:MAG TPA: RIP metalloprotease RseP [Opitutaceae bacterium]|jgi:regulator of sigma E protease
MQNLAALLTQNLWVVLLIVVFFGGSIFVHELGHFLAARWMGLKVDRFSIGFGPAIWSWHGKDGVEYRLAWFPLGGYVLLPQLADLGAIEGKATSDVSKLPPPSYGAKMLTFVAGATFNVLFAFALATVVWIVGQPQSADLATAAIGYVSPTLDVGNGKTVPSPANAAGLKAGDIIRSIDGSPVKDWNDVTTFIKLSSGRTSDGQPELRMGIERAGVLSTLLLHPKLGGDEHYRQIGILPRLTLVVDELTDNSAAAKAGVLKGDQIERADGTPLYSLIAFNDALTANIGKPISLLIRRSDREQTIAVTPIAGTKASDPTALATGFESFTSPIIFIHPSPQAQIWEEIVMTARQVGSVFNPHSDVGLSKMTGIIGIVSFYHEVAPEGLIPVIALTILININLAILNLLPIPVLDGGQMLFATIGWIRGRSLPLNFIVTTQSVFIMLFLVLMVYIGWFDILRLRHG